jgi:hypothetical protein
LGSSTATSGGQIVTFFVPPFFHCAIRFCDPTFLPCSSNLIRENGEIS